MPTAGFPTWSSGWEAARGGRPPAGGRVGIQPGPRPRPPPPPRFVAATGVRVGYHGRAAHAALNPYDGVNAADAMTVAQVAIGLLRQHLRPGELVHGIVSEAGSAPNVIPALSRAEYGLRAPTLAGLSALTDRLRDCFEAGALASGARLEWQADPVSYADLRADDTLAELYRDNRRAVSPDAVEPTGVGDRIAGSTDFGNLSQAVPALHPLFDIGAPTPYHHPDFAAAAATPAAERAMLDAALTMAWTAIDAAADPALLRLSADRPPNSGEGGPGRR
ncbi:MAG: peptidase dimerization domain-containing protein [Micromonosporaceae bacterium]